MSGNDRIRGYLIGVPSDPIGVQVDVAVADDTVSCQIDPLSAKSVEAPLTSESRDVRRYMSKIVERIRVESQRNVPVTSDFKEKRKPAPVYVKCPECHAIDSQWCRRCRGTGGVRKK